MKPDIAQRIAKALTRTTGPRAPTEGIKNKDGVEVVGSVPTHLRHLHNLLEELGDEVVAAHAELHTRTERLNQVRSLFFDSLKSQVDLPKEATGMKILDDWSVIPNFEEPDDARGMLDGLEALLASAGFPHR